MRYARLAAPLLLATLATACGGSGDADVDVDAPAADSIAPGMTTGTTGAPGPGTVGTPGTPAATDPDTLNARPGASVPQ